MGGLGLDCEGLVWEGLDLAVHVDFFFSVEFF